MASDERDIVERLREDAENFASDYPFDGKCQHVAMSLSMAADDIERLRGQAPPHCTDGPVYIEDRDVGDETDERELPTYVYRALALVDMALESRKGLVAVGRQTGGTAPELVQGLLDKIAQLWAKVPETPAPSEGEFFLFIQQDRAADYVVSVQPGGLGARWTKEEAIKAMDDLRSRLASPSGAAAPQSEREGRLRSALEEVLDFYAPNGTTTRHPSAIARRALDGEGA